MKKISYLHKLFVSLITIALLTTAVTIPANAEEVDTLNINASAAILIDFETGKVLYDKNADTLLPVASMTKMMTEYLLLEAIHDGKLAWDDEYEVSEVVYHISQQYPALSNVPLRRDGVYSVRELYEAMAIYSANGATIALAEMVAGSETNFVRMMNEKAGELGLEDYEFINSTGLNNEDMGGYHPEGTAPDAETRLSARATAKLAYHLIHDFPEILETASIPKKVFREGTSDAIDMPNWNWMVSTERYAFNKDGAVVDGLKTGSTLNAGYCFTGTVEHNGKRLITVVMNATKDESNTEQLPPQAFRFLETARMFSYGLDNFNLVELFPEGYQPEETTLPVIKGKDKEVEIATVEPLNMMVKRGEEEQFEPVFVINEELLNENGELIAPIEKGTKIGYFTVEYTGGQDLGYLYDDGSVGTVDVVTVADVQKANWFVLVMRGIGGFFGDIWSSVASTVKGWF
ncbi:D-alanyl-D-alanine carboxypeptidase [Sutcliffiella cohnii]|uniref:serine-type D-Ala-D-Ala carboxypeptidase n=1 Tax=Sutcliffiella cohnii TaxID=33932 RepID=A0A223KX08_9BACI|nr:D-alanyl-D-alanine carboxypeptidase family protein [Sutcliffiella cohnii]AST93944.1 D-alanyl-D-alanine carboxypeptidase [Sutcliffiella cohnii]